MKKLKRERLFIVPNGYGLMYGFGIVISLLAAATYTNNLIYSLSFFLVGLFLVGMIQTNSNLKKTEFEKVSFEIAEEGGVVQGRLWLKNESGENHYNLNFRFPEISKELGFEVEKLPAKGIAICNFSFPANLPGIHKITKLQLRTVYPFGMFYSWKPFQVDFNYAVHPKGEGDLALPQNVLMGESYHHQWGSGGEDFSEHRYYQEGEPYHHVDWKAFARRDRLLTKKFEDGDRQNILIDMFKLGLADKEALRQMVQWVDSCTNEKISYALKLKSGEYLEMGYGPYQKQRALYLIAQEWNREAS